MCSAKEIVAAIGDYADAYANLQRCQETSDLMPEGDQKTGSIGEFYANLYLQSTYPGAILRWGSLSEKGWDLEVGLVGKFKRIQVKTVSAYSRTRRISPLHWGWDELFLVYLGKDFRPEGFWLITGNALVPQGRVLRGLNCCTPDGRYAGSRALNFGSNRIEEFQRAVNERFEELEAT